MFSLSTGSQDYRSHWFAQITFLRSGEETEFILKSNLLKIDALIFRRLKQETEFIMNFWKLGALDTFHVEHKVFGSLQYHLLNWHDFLKEAPTVITVSTVITDLLKERCN